jgi:hypothetical protein
MKFLCLLVIVLCSSSTAFGQCDDSASADGLTWEYDPGNDDGFSIGSFLRDALTPQIITDTRRIREYVRDLRFRGLTLRCGDLRAVDAIYLRALKIADYEISRALFISLMAVLEHQNVKMKFPVVSSFSIPLTFEDDSLFRARKEQLPAHVYPDTPKEGDRDKLQHFFASAYISYASESTDLARASGNAVEWGEAQFIVGGADDDRDRRANKHGERFGRDLLVVKTLLPSDYLAMPELLSGGNK